MSDMTTTFLVLMLVAATGGIGVIIYDYLMGKIQGTVAWATVCIVLSIMGLILIQLIT